VRKILLLIMITAVLASGLLVGCGGGTPTTSGTTPSVTAAPEKGKPAPDFTLTDLDGKTVTLSSLKGKRVLINFWATWCVPCFNEMPYFQAVYKNNAYKDLAFLSIDVGESSSRTSGYMEKNAFSFKQVLVDSKSDVALKYGIQFLPTTIMIDADGIIKLLKIGEFVDLKELEGEIALNLGEFK
jgi:thiol-disulfide isomerase/thioredoxin